MTPTLDVALLRSSRAGTDLGCESRLKKLLLFSENFRLAVIRGTPNDAQLAEILIYQVNLGIKRGPQWVSLILIND